MAAYNARQRPDDDRVADAAGDPARRVGLGRARDVGLDGGAQHRRRPATRRSTSPCPARTARGATRSSPPCATGRVSEAAIDDEGRCGCCGSPRASARSTASSRRAARAPWSDEEIAAELRATAAAGFVLARNDGAAAAASRRAGSPCSGPNAAVARTLGGGSATVFPPYTVSPLEGLRARSGSRSRTRPACAPTRGSRRRRRSCCPAASTCASSTPTDRELGAEHRARRRVHVARHAAARHRGDRAARHAARRRRRASTSSACTGRRPPPALARRRGAVRPRASSCPPGADLGEAVLRPPQHGVPGARSTASRELRPALRARARRCSMAAVHLNVEPPFGDEEAELERAVALAREADVAVVVVGTNEEVECEGFDRDDARPARPPGRAGRPRRAGQPAHRRGRQRRRAGAAAVGRRRRRDPARLVPGPGVRQRARRRPHSAPPSPAAGCPRRGRSPRRACPRPRRRTASSPTTRACSSATAPTSATAASRCSRSATASATRRWEYLAVEPAGTHVTVRLRNTGDAPRPRGGPGLRLAARQRRRAAAALARRLRRSSRPTRARRSRSTSPIAAARARALGRRLDRRARRVPLRGQDAVVNTRSPAIVIAASGAVQRRVAGRERGRGVGVRRPQVAADHGHRGQPGRRPAGVGIEDVRPALVGAGGRHRAVGRP